MSLLEVVSGLIFKTPEQSGEDTYIEETRTSKEISLNVLSIKFSNIRARGRPQINDMTSRWFRRRVVGREKFRVVGDP